MAILCVTGAAPGIGKTAVAELLLSQLEGWHAARVRVADEIPDAQAALIRERGYLLLTRPEEVTGDAEVQRLLAAGAGAVTVLAAEARGLAAGVRAMLAALPKGANLLVEGNAFLWAGEADVAIMVIGPPRSGKGLIKVRPSARELFAKINVWAWNTRDDPTEEGFFEFPQSLDRMGFKEAVNNRADFHHVNPRRDNHPGNGPFLASVEKHVARLGWRRAPDAPLRGDGLDG